MCGNDRPAGWRKDDGIGKDMWRHMAEPPRLTRNQTDLKASDCGYRLTLTTVPAKKSHTGEEYEVYRCYLGQRLGRQCLSYHEMCYEGTMQVYFPESPSAVDARTGGLPTN